MDLKNCCKNQRYIDTGGLIDVAGSSAAHDGAEKPKALRELREVRLDALFQLEMSLIYFVATV